MAAIEIMQDAEQMIRRGMNPVHVQDLLADRGGALTLARAKMRQRGLHQF